MYTIYVRLIKKDVTQVPNDEISSFGFTSETELASPPNNMIAQTPAVVNNKGSRTKILLRILEVIEKYGNFIGKQRVVGRILGGDWMRTQHNLENSNVGSGEGGSNTGNASVLQGESPKFIGSKAFRNVVKNLFEIQRRAELAKDSEDNALAEAQQEYFKDSKVRDENGWEIRKAYAKNIKGDTLEVKLNIAKARDGRDIIYAVSNTKS